MGQGKTCGFEDVELGRVRHDQRIAGKRRSRFIAEPATMRDDKLNIQPEASFGKSLKYLLLAILQSSKGSIDQRPPIELVPREGNLAVSCPAKRSYIVKASGQCGARKVKGRGLLTDL